MGLVDWLESAAERPTKQFTNLSFWVTLSAAGGGFFADRLLGTFTEHVAILIAVSGLFSTALCGLWHVFLARRKPANPELGSFEDRHKRWTLTICTASVVLATAFATIMPPVIDHYFPEKPPGQESEAPKDQTYSEKLTTAASRPFDSLARVISGPSQVREDMVVPPEPKPAGHPERPTSIPTPGIKTNSPDSQRPTSELQPTSESESPQPPANTPAPARPSVPSTGRVYVLIANGPLGSPRYQGRYTARADGQVDVTGLNQRCGTIRGQCSGQRLIGIRRIIGSPIVEDGEILLQVQ